MTTNYRSFARKRAGFLGVLLSVDGVVIEWPFERKKSDGKSGKGEDTSLKLMDGRRTCS